MQEERYRWGVVFKSEILESVPGYDAIREDIQLLTTLRQIVYFLTNDIRTTSEAMRQLDNIDDLVYDLYEINAISSHLYESEDSQLKLVQIFLSLCRMVINLFEDIGFYTHCKSNLIGRPTVMQLRNKRHFVIFVRKQFPLKR